MISATTVIDAWTAVNNFLPLSSLVVLVVSGAVLAYAIRVGLGFFRRGVR